MTAGEADAPALQMVGISKHFGPVCACGDVDLSVAAGEIHGLLGENGAGKSTLMKVLLGLVTPDSGQILLRGKPETISDPLTAAARGIAMVHQHFSLVGRLTVWENIALGDRGRVDREHIRTVVREVGERYGLAVDPDARVEDLSTGERQRVEIVKCLRRDPDVLVLDEPTSVLTLEESRDLFTVLRRVVADEGKAVILISHKLDEIIHATDKVTIMRQGRVVGRRITAETDERALAREMVGRELSKWTAATAVGVMDALIEPGQTEPASGPQLEVAEEPTTADEPSAQEVSTPEGSVAADPSGATPSAAAPTVTEATTGVLLRIKDAHAISPEKIPLLRGLTLELRAGEILGIAGVEGNGQSAVGDLFSSLLPLTSGTVEVDGKTIAAGRPGAMHAAGIGVIPEDRHASGCVLDMSVAENLVLADLGGISKRGLLSRSRLNERARALIEEFEIATPSPDTPMRLLSGGNQQKVVLARELSARPRVLVAAQPTRGLDIGAIEYMTLRLHEAAKSGIAVLLLSTELSEILTLSQRIAVIHRGTIVGEMDRADVDVERLGMMMGGQTA
ncbi:ABC transporter ATP-binding protein [Streptomyces albipurpureus]|uniref:ABC transporter ATP-binding protein n=1 Tax=Streptomyces albipurpureus TaxID=2897419 RepID=A0ABT0ULV5_9ACTN|nr:ABC transporter ATP-binding protein [Streptomyces sp. CWNU-1]MCM2388600.1 ABC transporter ATP-binding protein [Streptomyces sp. CWNU-1]